MSERVIVQVTGEANAGKSELCSYFEEQYGFSVVLISEIIRTFADERDIQLTAREDYLAAHKQMKTEQGNDVIAKTVLDNPSDRLCVDGIRVINDAVRLRNTQAAASIIVALHCPPEIRHERSLARGSTLDRSSFEKFLEDDKRDAYSSDLEGPNTFAVMGAADYHIDSSVPREQVQQAADKILLPILV